MSRKGSNRQRSRNRGPAPVATLRRPSAPPPAQSIPQALPLVSKAEPLVELAARDKAVAPLPRSLSLVDPRRSTMQKLRSWMLGVAERWVERHRPLPEQPTLAQLTRLRNELASMQRRIERLIG